MTFQDFMDSVFARIRRPPGPEIPAHVALPGSLAGLGGHAAVAGLIEAAPLFLLGDGEEIARVKGQLLHELVEDLSEGLLAPFPSVSIAHQSAAGWSLDWLHRLGKGDRGDRFVHLGFSDRTELPGFPNSVEFEFGGGSNGEFLAYLSPDTAARYLAVDRARPPDAVLGDVGRMLSDVMFLVALISHPTQFVVEKTPALSPREERRLERGIPRPVRKRAHYIVVDHEGLSELNPATRAASGPHRPPVPHARRGHWMRLSERCLKARAQGRTRVWVRETYVGEREFVEEGNRYRVFLSAAELPSTHSTT